MNIDLGELQHNEKVFFKKPQDPNDSYNSGASKNILLHMNMMVSTIVRAKEYQPKAILMGKDVWLAYVAALQPQNPPALSFLGIPVIFHIDMPDKLAYFLDPTGTKIDGVFND